MTAENTVIDKRTISLTELGLYGCAEVIISRDIEKNIVCGTAEYDGKPYLKYTSYLFYDESKGDNYHIEKIIKSIKGGLSKIINFQ